MIKKKYLKSKTWNIRSRRQFKDNIRKKSYGIIIKSLKENLFFGKHYVNPFLKFILSPTRKKTPCWRFAGVFTIKHKTRMRRRLLFFQVYFKIKSVL